MTKRTEPTPDPEIVLPEAEARGRKYLADLDRLCGELPELFVVGKAASREFTEASRER